MGDKNVDEMNDEKEKPNGSQPQIPIIFGIIIENLIKSKQENPADHKSDEMIVEPFLFFDAVLCVQKQISLFVVSWFGCFIFGKHFKRIE